MTPTPEQQAILERPPIATIKVAAGAGCGKTSTLVEYGRAWPTRGLYLAFNRSIADEAGRKFPRSIETRTAHSFAYKALDIGRRGNVVPKLRFEHLRPYADLITGVPGLPAGRVRSAILKTIDNFMIDAGSKLTGAHCPLPDRDHRTAVRTMTQAILRRLLRFETHDNPITHDTYLKAFELWHRIDGPFEYLLLDEAQDLNPVLISIARKSKLPTVIVGDTYQSIYRFRGAVDAMDAFAVDELPLTQSWRFGQSVAVLANRILAHHSKPPRHRLRGNPDRTTEILPYSGKIAPQPGTAILARTNARLFDSLATIARPFHLVGGFSDLRRQLESAYALKQERLDRVDDPVVSRYASWRALEYGADRGDGDARRLRDIVEKHGDNLPVVLERLAGFHRDNEGDAHLVVSTAHKAKGREFATVIVLDDFELPADIRQRRIRDSTQTSECDQLINLLYVACTRATNRLLLAPKLYDALR